VHSLHAAFLFPFKSFMCCQFTATHTQPVCCLVVAQMLNCFCFQFHWSSYKACMLPFSCPRSHFTATHTQPVRCLLSAQSFGDPSVSNSLQTVCCLFVARPQVQLPCSFRSFGRVISRDCHQRCRGAPAAMPACAACIVCRRCGGAGAGPRRTWLLCAGAGTLF